MAVAIDAVYPSSAGAGTAATTSLSWSHTCSGTNRLLIVGISLGVAADAGYTTTATYNGVSMNTALIVHSGNATAGYIQMFYLVNPATGANTVQVTASSAADLTGGSISFTGVDQSTPLAGTTSNIGWSFSSLATINNSAGNIVVDLATNGSNITGSTQTQAWFKYLNSNTAAGMSACSTSAATGAVNMGYNSDNDQWAIIATSVQAVGSPAAASGAWFKA